MERKLSAIMAGDIVGYSRHMAEDEAGTYSELRSVLDELIAPTILKHRGRTFKSAGDGFLAAFPSVNEALDAAIEIQRGFADRTFNLRIGINLGDVIEDNGDVFGDGVNVASRLESMAEPGSIFVSAAVVRSAERERAKLFYRIGRRQAKNIPEPLDVYAVRLTAGPALWQRLSRPRQMLRRAAPYAAAIAVIGGAAALADVPPFRGISREISNGVALLSGIASVDVRPSVAVLPFDNMSDKADEGYFADGLTEDIITELARNPELQVIARNSTFALRGRPADVREIGERLGAGYIVEGSARRAGDKLRVVAQLIDSRSGAHIWSRSYDRGVDDVFAVQTELTSEIVAHLVSYVRVSEIENAARRPTENLQAYDLVLRGRDRYRHGSKDKDAFLASRTLFQRALELDPSYAAARAHLGMTYILDKVQSVSGLATDADLETGLSEARQAIRLDPNLASGYQALSFGLAAKGDYPGARQAAQQAVELNPNDPDSLMALAKAQVRFGEYANAVANAERARRLHPMAPEYYIYVHGQALYAAGRLDDADKVLDECLIRAPQAEDCLLIKTAVLTGQGKLAGAQDMMARLVKASPDLSLAKEREYRRFGDSDLMERFLADLARARAPETATALKSMQPA
ncbi:adenylate/guanylate cyclase domain-containing protein [Rhizobium bangladeshense]|uniref:Tetratricopeptide repeat protein n=1 Tax=Rhizobium bangladeshense TaxID=1138189 RepID=A0ABS7LR39_9HYPH|nr:adenylate/guanylate cyclase domain-containing protein [Rhizobium bangladeshense]MBX4875979.1 tetratricopeptide repeat protein [Rhizobium bangladeshense]MBX4886867.1 tetratricopeptide repeat protein [Rhizobium bangladeshense]MBX4893148.1 tetratricopeptide repeat protein [Rhizobium bangladeshense]MBX4905308.1 tetratricopeptide repeat protein [Rhizobium bangladeshense]MBX4917137.1 tetratricopeptide repeat protein [Rhizobium bangladeshense]